MDLLFIYDIDSGIKFTSPVQGVIPVSPFAYTTKKQQLPYPDTSLWLPYKSIYKHIHLSNIASVYTELRYVHSRHPLLLVTHLRSYEDAYTLHAFIESLELGTDFPFIVSNSGAAMIERIPNASTFNFIHDLSPTENIDPFKHTNTFYGTIYNFELTYPARPTPYTYISSAQEFDPVLRGTCFEFCNNHIRIHLTLYTLTNTNILILY